MLQKGDGLDCSGTDLKLDRLVQNVEDLRLAVGYKKKGRIEVNLEMGNSSFATHGGGVGFEAGMGFFKKDEVAIGLCELGSGPKVLRSRPQVELRPVYKAMGLEAGPSSSFVAYG